MPTRWTDGRERAARSSAPRTRFASRRSRSSTASSRFATCFATSTWTPARSASRIASRRTPARLTSRTWCARGVATATLRTKTTYSYATGTATARSTSAAWCRRSRRTRFRTSGCVRCATRAWTASTRSTRTLTSSWTPPTPAGATYSRPRRSWTRKGRVRVRRTSPKRTRVFPPARVCSTRTGAATSRGTRISPRATTRATTKDGRPAAEGSPGGGGGGGGRGGKGGVRINAISSSEMMLVTHCASALALSHLSQCVWSLTTGFSPAVTSRK
mmetsp:Transcript_14104/g.57302  ORF Transcript_14104/g.57302 Transcript_14104/m.57302 type:complete len:273 (-) Transcript_14104:1330-2148(-)